MTEFFLIGPDSTAKSAFRAHMLNPSSGFKPVEHYKPGAYRLNFNFRFNFPDPEWMPGSSFYGQELIIMPDDAEKTSNLRDTFDPVILLFCDFSKPESLDAAKIQYQSFKEAHPANAIILVNTMAAGSALVDHSFIPKLFYGVKRYLELTPDAHARDYAVIIKRSFLCLQARSDRRNGLEGEQRTLAAEISTYLEGLVRPKHISIPTTKIGLFSSLSSFFVAKAKEPEPAYSREDLSMAAYVLLQVLQGKKRDFSDLTPKQLTALRGEPALAALYNKADTLLKDLESYDLVSRMWTRAPVPEAIAGAGVTRPA
jgi:hypothetical protein